jgi:hypothetical protein
MPVRYNNHNIRLVLTAKHQGQLDTSITNNQQSTHDKPTSFAGKQILGKKKKTFAEDLPELQRSFKTGQRQAKHAGST